MRFLLVLTLLISFAMAPAKTHDPVSIYDFRKGTPMAWRVQDDTVMGGVSQGQVEMTDKGHARFYGHVSLENNGGFSSILYTLNQPVDVAGLSVFNLRVKGDGKSYTLRVKSDPDQDYYHQASFPTSGEWEQVQVPFGEMTAVHHGEPVDVPNFAGGPVHEVQLLIGNKKEQDFEVLVDRIEAK
ncbi:CIA30 family protein [Neolewinella sp.]|uniref:CIA30 family protein n=1 Tax=Neolewinella sp. TaxID=2993543 RepID=UPI003B5233E4